MMRWMFVMLLMVSLSLIGSATALADGNCPPGYYEVGGSGVSGCNAYPTTSNEAAPAPGPEWRTRWGAIATASGGILGVANNSSSRRKAENAAMKQCKAKKGKDCSVSLSFGNQCGALAWGDTYLYSVASVEQSGAEAQALENCNEHTRNCRVFYSACSYPERMR